MIEENEKNIIIPFLGIILISLWRVVSHRVTVNVEVAQLLINDNLAVLPYLLIVVLTGTIVLSKSRTNNPMFSRKLAKIVALFLLITAASFVLIGTLPAFDAGMDHDEATEAWIDAFIHGDNPYDPASHPTEPRELTVLPLFPLVTIPLYFVFDIAFLSVVGVAVIIQVIRKLSSDDEIATWGLLLVALSLPLYYRLLAQSNYVEMAAVFVAGVYFLHQQRWILSGIVFGLAFATKAIVWPLLPIVAYHVYRQQGVLEVLKFLTISGTVGVLLVGPFVVWDPYIFFNVAPIGVSSGHVSLPIPYAKLLLPLGSIISSIVIYEWRGFLMSGLLTSAGVMFLGLPGRYMFILTIFFACYAVTVKNRLGLGSFPIRTEGTKRAERDDIV